MPWQPPVPGADAVYLGGKQFGARQFAANFSDEELVQAVRYAHLRGVLVYVTVNTLVAEREMEDALRTCFSCLQSVLTPS